MSLYDTIVFQMIVPRANPGNLRYSSSIVWQGQVGQQGGFCVFSNIDYGARALVIDLRNAQRLHNRNTIRTIITAYAPPNENDTAAYISAVCSDMKLAADAPLNLYSDRQTMRNLAAAVWHHEQGQAPDQAALDFAIRDVFGWSGSLQLYWQRIKQFFGAGGA
jgi:hypothetical protein